MNSLFVPDIPGLEYYPQYLTTEHEEDLLESIYMKEWSSSLKRKVQHYGYTYDYRKSTVGSTDAIPASFILTKLEVEKTAYCEFDQLIINQYTTGQGIAPHTDAPLFGPTIASLSLGADTTMNFYGPQDREEEIFLEQGSLLVLGGESRSHWKHEIKPKDIKNTRVSMTFRKVLK